MSSGGKAARALRVGLSAVSLLLLLMAGGRRLGPLPPLGPLLDPVHGVWSVASQAELPRQASGRVPGLSAPVRVIYDDRGVPHIFAAAEEDAIRALGYVVARDRLFQLELEWRAGAGRLTELLGSRALPLDREARRLGLPWAAERKLAAADPASAGRRAIEAFAEGVNAWIDQGGRRAVPLEYHLLGARPARWAPINSIHLLNRMGWTLAYNDLEPVKEQARRAFGAAAADALYPINSPIQEPIQPGSRDSPRYAWSIVPGPGRPGLVGRKKTAAGQGQSAEGPAESLPASNNWAVAPSRSTRGHALLAGDPHLGLSLPSIWYEAQLKVPGVVDAYGVTIPGAPAILIGFNRDLAWSFTSTDADVLDRYREVVNDSGSPTNYRVDGQWRRLVIRPEVYLGPRGDTLAIDTMRFTHRGPLQRSADGWISLRWTVLEPRSGFGSFLRAARAGTARQWLEAMADYLAPAQNGLVADRAGTIAIRSIGAFPIRPGGRGDVLQDGSLSRNDWTGYWPLAAYPQAIDPTQGYLASANQQPIDPAQQPRYLGANWYSPWRALRINQLLRADSLLTPDAMRRFQTDPGSAAADLFVPALLAAARRHQERDSATVAARLLAQWDRRYAPGNTRAVLYESVMEALNDLLWDELQPTDGNGVELPRPGAAVVAELLQDPENPWWDRRDTPAIREDRDLILAEALELGLSRTLRHYGPPDAGGWLWSGIRHANLPHLLGIRAFSALGIPVQGGPTTLSPSSGDGAFGASWRMVVELGPEVRAWGTYPGGQSGNPASSRYLDRLRFWRDGQLDTLRFPRGPDDLGQHATSRLTLEPAR